MNYQVGKPYAISQLRVFVCVCVCVCVEITFLCCLFVPNFGFFCTLPSDWLEEVTKMGQVKTWLPSVWFRSWSRSLAVRLQVTWVINPAVGCHYFLPGPQLPPQPLRGLLPVSLLGEQRHDGCEQFAWDCYPTALRLRFKPSSFCAWVQHANHSATELRWVKWDVRSPLITCVCIM